MADRHLVLVDGSNVVMRAAFGGKIEPAVAVPTATGMLTRFVRELGATHVVVAMDIPGGGSWRRELYPAYQANRDGRDTGAWLTAATDAWASAGWCVVGARGYQADDVIATVATRTRHVRTTIVSNDSDLLQLADMVPVARPVAGSALELWDEARVRAEYGIRAAALLADFKAIAGEPGDGIPGPFGKCCEGKARKILGYYRDLQEALTLGAFTEEQRAVVERAYALVQLKVDAPVPPIESASCRVPRARSVA